MSSKTAVSPNRRVLLVDDTPNIHEDYRKILGAGEECAELDALAAAVFGPEETQADTSFTLTSAMQGQEALERVLEAQKAGIAFASAFVDMRMPPGWDGLQTIEKLWEVDPRIQVVICTAYSDSSLQEIASRVGGGSRLLILKKPFDPIEVRQLAATLCEKWLLERQADAEKENLERLVADRTASIQLLLDSTGDGIFTVTRDGRIMDDRSKAIESWLGSPGQDQRVWDYLAGGNPDLTTQLRLSFIQMADDLLPFEVSATQSPSRIVKDERTLDLHYREIRDADQLDRILVILRDISALVESERTDEEVRQLQSILSNLFESPESFNTALAEVEQLLSRIKTCTDFIGQRRLIHTLKGNTSILGFRRFSQQIHQLENEIEHSNSLLGPEKLASIQSNWTEQTSKLGPFRDFCQQDVVRIKTQELDRLIDRLRQGDDQHELLRIAEQWKLQPLRLPLNRLAKQAERIASQVGKKLVTRIDDGGVKLPEEHLAEVWPPMIHLIRNAVDHGLETPDERLSAGKPESGTLCLEANFVDGLLEIRVQDDGRGINWEGIREQALRTGHLCETDADLATLLFSDGLSTKETATELSGRGVGLSAVKDVVTRSGGTVGVVSNVGSGTCFVIRLPVHPTASVGANSAVRALATPSVE